MVANELWRHVASSDFRRGQEPVMLRSAALALATRWGLTSLTTDRMAGAAIATRSEVQVGWLSAGMQSPWRGAQAGRSVGQAAGH